MKISKNFRVRELIKTSQKVDNYPDEKSADNLLSLVISVLQPARNILAAPITVTSGFRSKEVNRLVGGTDSSQHVKGEAVDLSCEDNAKLFGILKTMEFDQLIWEFGDDFQPKWIHVSFKEKGNRKEILRAKKVNGKTVYERLK